MTLIKEYSKNQRVLEKIPEVALGNLVY